MANKSRELDDVPKRISSSNSYKNRVFDGKRSTTDEYTGERIFYGNVSDAKHLHGLDKTTDVDHITPIAKIKERYGDLKIEQQRTLANNEHYNYAMTNSKLNRLGKNASENHEYLAKKAKTGMDSLMTGDLKRAEKELSELANQAPRMLEKEVKSRTGMAIEGNAMRIENLVDDTKTGISKTMFDFAEGASDAMMVSAMPLMVLGVQNICEVASGQKTMEEASAEMGEAALEIGAVGGGTKLAQKAINEMAEKLGSDFLGTIAKNSSQFVQIALVSRLVFQSFAKLVNDEISGAEFFEEIGEKGVGLVGDVLGATMGSGLMGILLPATVAAGPAAFLVGAAAFVGGMVVSAVCTGIYRYTAALRESYLEKERLYQAKISTINRIADQALMEMQYQQHMLKNMIKEEYAEWGRNFEAGFQKIRESMFSDNFEQLADGMNQIISVFGKSVLFKDMEEFDAFFFDDNAVLSL
jgi:hypothetical protein